MRNLALAYGLVSYVLFLAAFLYAVGFVADLYVPKTINVPPTDTTWQQAVILDAALLLLFAVPHSVMARQGFKSWWTSFVPAPVERSTYVLTSSVLLAVMYWYWIPVPTVIWEVGLSPLRTMLWALFCAGWLLALVSTLLIDHFDLFGLRQVYLYWAGRPYEPITFRTPLLYRWVRHPLILGFLIAFWAAPTMTGGRLLFAVATTAYCLVAVRLEERDLLRFFGDQYARYQRRVRMLVPIPRRRRDEQ